MNGRDPSPQDKKLLIAIDLIACCTLPSVSLYRGLPCTPKPAGATER